MALSPHPKPWTHHHTHRLFHMTMGLCFMFAALSVVGTMGSVWYQAYGATVTDQGDINITATVAGISPGPVTGGSSGSIPKPKPTANPTITIYAEPQGQVPLDGSTYIFSNDHPAFSGTASVPNGLIFITVRGEMEINSTAVADAQGKWYWQSPVDLINGEYTIRAAVFDSYDLTHSGYAEATFKVNVKEIIEPPVPTPTPTPTPTPGKPTPTPTPTPVPTPTPTPGGPSLPPPPTPQPGVEFGLFFTILDDYKYATSGKDVVASVTLVSRDDKAVANQEVHFTVLSPEGKIILETSDKITFNKQTQFLKTFITAPGTPSGEYTVKATSTYNGITSTTSDKFNLVQPAATAVTSPYKQGPIIIWSLLFLLWLLFIILVIIAYRRLKHYNEQLHSASLQPVRPLSDQQQSRLS